ncbi:hypothetical protein ACR9YC_07005 [Parasphingorhabdus sp. DH2-15]|uniref:hypothetical protein n=1 Tax=Parasphingorhabdus sp. DH2-15 TaxID=3444112 RepID=UPI003F683F3A
MWYRSYIIVFILLSSCSVGSDDCIASIEREVTERLRNCWDTQIKDGEYYIEAQVMSLANYRVMSASLPCPGQQMQIAIEDELLAEFGFHYGFGDNGLWEGEVYDIKMHGTPIFEESQPVNISFKVERIKSIKENKDLTIDDMTARIVNLK